MTDIVKRLRGQYESGPHLPNGQPEFGIRQFQSTPINREAAQYIEELRETIASFNDTEDKRFAALWDRYDQILLIQLEMEKEIDGLKASRDKYRDEVLELRRQRAKEKRNATQDRTVPPSEAG